MRRVTSGDNAVPQHSGWWRSDRCPSARSSSATMRRRLLGLLALLACALIPADASRALLKGAAATEGGGVGVKAAKAAAADAGAGAAAKPAPPPRAVNTPLQVEPVESKEQAVVQEAVLEQELFDEHRSEEERKTAASSALFVGFLLGGTAMYCAMKGREAGRAAAGGGASAAPGGGAGGAAAGGRDHAHGGPDAAAAAPEADDLKQRLNRLKALQAAQGESNA